MTYTITVTASSFSIRAITFQIIKSEKIKDLNNKEFEIFKSIASGEELLSIAKKLNIRIEKLFYFDLTLPANKD